MSQGIYPKYIVQRTDGKQEDCFYFVLNLDKDPHAIIAITAYAESCRESNPQLAMDLMEIVASKRSIPTTT